MNGQRLIFLGLSQREVENLGLRPASLKQIYELHIEKSSGSGVYQLKQMDFAYKGEQQSLHIPAVNFTKGTAIAVIGKKWRGKEYLSPLSVRFRKKMFRGSAGQWKIVLFA